MGSLAIIGLGALGQWLLPALAARSEHVLLVDPDVVGEENVGRTFTSDQVGRRKVDIASERLAGKASAVARPIADIGWQDLAGCSMLVTALDRDSARLEVARISTRLGIPVLDCGVSEDGLRGRVTWFAGREAACFGCRLTAQRRRELLSTWSATAHPCRVANENRVWRHVEATLQALTQTAEQAFNGVHTPTSWSQETGPTAEVVEVPLSAACPFHAGPVRLVSCEGRFCDVGPVSWEWPVAVRAECGWCEHAWSPRKRKALVEQGGCPKCGSAHVLVEALREVSASSEWWQRCPEDLGLPARHLYYMPDTLVCP